MPLQNRVNPFGKIIATPERGAWTGNRGVIHNEQQKIIRNHAIKYWITCLLNYKDFQRKVMSPNRWTELFFWDEATAFAAGHRPCGFCRNADFKRFKKLWIEANGDQYGFSEKTKMSEIDEVIHQERLTENGTQKTFKAKLADLPDGTFITIGEMGKAYLWFDQNLFEWSFSGYRKLGFFDKNQTVDVLTPVSYVEVFKKGYVPQVQFLHQFGS